MISCIKDLTNFVFCFGYFSSSNFVGFVLTFPKNGVITNKQANSSAVLFLFCFISELKKKKALIYSPAWYVMRSFHQTLLLIELVLISARLMQVYVLMGFCTQMGSWIRPCWCKSSGHHCRDRDLSVENSLQDWGIKANAFGLKHN